MRWKPVIPCGTRTIVDVLDATTTLYNAKQQLANARYTYLIQSVKRQICARYAERAGFGGTEQYAG
jgi:hypothetical protein